MKVLVVDMHLSPRWVTALQEAGIEARHAMRACGVDGERFSPFNQRGWPSADHDHPSHQ